MKISIITPSYNRVGMIETAIQSVLDQNYPEVEHIIIDGGSTDGTLDVLKKYPHLRVVSEPDQGMYDALNKGLALATGEIIGFLNTDDAYAAGAFQTAFNILAADPEADIAWGSADVIERIADGEKIKAVLHPPGKKEEIIQYITVDIPIFNACFFRKQVFERLGGLNPQLKISGDREFMLRVALGGGRFHPTDVILYHYYAHDDSLTFGNNLAFFEQWNMEHCQVAEFYLGQPNTPERARAAYRRLHTKSNISLIKVALKRGNLTRAFSLVLHGWRVNPDWPLLFAKKCLKLLINWVQG